jgi:hypothetical protein
MAWMECEGAKFSRSDMRQKTHDDVVGPGGMNLDDAAKTENRILIKDT